MSCFFAVDGHDVWNPSNRVARIFVGQVSQLEAAYGRQSGVGEIIDDECDIDGDSFSMFVEFISVKFSESNNPSLRVLLEGVISISMVLLTRASRAIQLPAEDEGHWLRVTHSLSPSMSYG